MKTRHYAALFLINLIILSGVAMIQTLPGYMDAEYYFAGAIRLFEGHGFTEQILWNYLDDPSGIPHPSHLYWMPLVSILGAAGMKLLSTDSYLAGRLVLFFIALCLPLGIAAWAYSLHHDRRLALLSGLLAIFSAFYLPYITHTDSFALVMALGLVFFICIFQLEKQTNQIWIAALAGGLGFTSGLMHLSRADGILWLAASLFYLIWLGKRKHGLMDVRLIVITLTAAMTAYLLVMGPWFWRNYQLFGSPFAPGNFQTLWLTQYDQLYIYPADSLTIQHWLASGWANILKARFGALGNHLQTLIAVQGEVFLLPLIVVGLWSMKQEKYIQMALAVWALLLIVMTVIFPFAGARGGFFHSGAALQPIFWIAAPIGLECVLEWAGKVRNWRIEQARRVFQPALIGMAVLLSGLLALGNPDAERQGLAVWGSRSREYIQVEQVLQEYGAEKEDIVMVNNPPGYYLASRRPAVSIPYGDVTTLLAVAQRYQVRYLLLEFNQLQGDLDLYGLPVDIQGIQFLKKVGEVKIFELILEGTTP